MIAARKIAVPVEETGTISSTAFSRSFFGSGVLCPVTASPLATFKCSRASSCFHDVCASIQSFAAGVPQNSTARVKSVNGVQARTTRPRSAPRPASPARRPLPTRRHRTGTATPPSVSRTGAAPRPPPGWRRPT